MSDLASFLKTTGRTLAQMTLYSAEHPAVKGAIAESHQLLAAVLQKEPEVTVSASDGNLLINGRLLEEIPQSTLRPFAQLLATYDLHSLSFVPGISPEEMIPFFTMASSAGKKSVAGNLPEYLSKNNMTHITINQAKYAKIGEDQTIGQGSATSGDGEGAGDEEGGTAGDQLVQALQKLSLYDALRKLIENTNQSPEIQQKIFSRLSNLIKEETERVVKEKTKELRIANQTVTNERDRTETVVNNAADGMVMVDKSGNVLMMNEAAEKMYGVKLSDCVGKPLAQSVKESQMMTLAKDLTIPEGGRSEREVSLAATDDTKKTLRASAATIQDPDGRVVGMVSVLSDVTKHKELLRMQNEFMANVTHDLRSPLHALKLSIYSILEGVAGDPTPEQKKVLTLANRNAERLGRLIDDLLDFSKIESGKMEIHTKPTDLAVLLSDTVTTLEAWSKNRGLKIVYDQPKENPPVLADPDRIVQVINNLVSNAIKFTPHGGEIRIRSKKVVHIGKPMVQVEVEDNGKGISAEDQKRVFGRFVQLKHTEKTDIHGTGLGLGIVKAFVELHKGKINLQSPPPNQKQGTMFSFTLPVAERANQIQSMAQETKKAAAVAATTKKKGFWKRLFGGFKIFTFLILLSTVAYARPYWGTVRRVLGPNVVQLDDGSKVRFLGVASPKQGEPHYAEAVSANRRLVERQEVRLEYGLEERDIDGAWLAYVFTDDYFINEELVLSGLALVARLANEEDYLPKLLKAERVAQEDKRGIWGYTKFEPYKVRTKKATGLPWANEEELRRGVKDK